MTPVDKIRLRGLLEEIKDQLSRGKKLAKATMGRLEAEIKIFSDSADVDNAVAPTSFKIKAFMKTDDEKIEGYFDAVEWLAVADGDAIESLCAEHTPSYTTDALYWWHDGGNGSAWSRKLAKTMGEYMNVVNTGEDKETVGFSVRIIDVDAMFEWIKANRPRTYENVRHLHGG